MAAPAPEGGAIAAAAGAIQGAPQDVVGVVPGVEHSRSGLARDRMMGGVKGKRMSKKDKAAAAQAAAEAEGGGSAGGFKTKKSQSSSRDRANSPQRILKAPAPCTSKLELRNCL